MEYSRSKSCGDGRMQQIKKHRWTGSKSSTMRHGIGIGKTQMPDNDAKLRKAKSSGSGCNSAKNWSLNDPELQRKKRVASYKVYTVEGKVKGSFNKSLRWLKDRYTRLVYGG